MPTIEDYNVCTPLALIPNSFLFHLFTWSYFVKHFASTSFEPCTFIFDHYKQSVITYSDRDRYISQVFEMYVILSGDCNTSTCTQKRLNYQRVMSNNIKTRRIPDGYINLCNRMQCKGKVLKVNRTCLHWNYHPLYRKIPMMQHSVII